MPLDVHDIRANNLKHLRGFHRGGQREMATKLGMSEAQLSQYIGKTRHKSMGSRLARKIERRLKLPHGWLDVGNHDLTEESTAFARRYQALNAAQKTALAALLDSFIK